MEEINWLSNWFNNNCDGEWEHNYSVKITTLDNPGWYLHIDLTETKQEGKILIASDLIDENDWYDVKSDGVTFIGTGDSSKLVTLINMFKKFVEHDS